MSKEKAKVEEIAEILEEEIEEKENNEEEMEQFEDVKEKRHIFRTLFNIIFWLVVAIMAVTWIMDYMKARDNKEPQFCLSKKTYEFEDGTVDECLGLGYKVYKYNRTSMATGSEFVPFFVDMKDNDETSTEKTNNDIETEE